MLQPKPGERYCHYKSTGGNHHVYEIIGIGKHSETDDIVVIYKPLFVASTTWLGDCEFAVRPLSMWFDELEWNGNAVQRFVRVK